MRHEGDKNEGKKGTMSPHSLSPTPLLCLVEKFFLRFEICLEIILFTFSRFFLEEFKLSNHTNQISHDFICQLYHIKLKKS